MKSTWARALGTKALQAGCAAALLLSVACNVRIFNCCLVYFAMLRAPSGMLGNYVEEGGGLSGPYSFIAQLVLVCAACSLAASCAERFKRVAVWSAGLSVLLWACAAILAQLVRALLH